MIKLSEFRGRAVVGMEHARKIGALDGLVLDLSVGRVIALKISNSEGQGFFYLPTLAVNNIGPDAITVSEVGLTNGAEFQGLPDSHSMAGTKVLTENGTLLGSISDVCVDESTLQLVGFQLGASGLDQLLGRDKFVQSAPGFRYGGDILMVPDAVTDSKAAVAQQADVHNAVTESNPQVVLAPQRAPIPPTPNARVSDQGPATRVIDLDDPANRAAVQPAPHNANSRQQDPQ